MASNHVDIMSQIHTFGNEIKVDVLKPENTNTTLSNTQATLERHSIPVNHDQPNGEIAKAVPVSAGKRRKVVEDNVPAPPVRRTTRFRAEKPPPPPTKRRSVSKIVTVEELKEKSRMTRTKKLQETYQQHDSKVRELFHLTKFVSLVDYDDEEAKRNESEVFREVR